MDNARFDDVLTVLSLAIFADKRIHAAEVDVFIKTATTLQLRLDQTVSLIATDVEAWFETNNRSIRGKMNQPRSEFEAWLTPILLRVKETSDHAAITHLMEMIAIADGEVHSKERGLINLVTQIWT